jgi:hypothetical protein
MKYQRAGYHHRLNTAKLLVWLLVIGSVIGGVIAGRGYLQRKWRGSERFTILTVGEKIQVESWDPQTKQGIRLVLPENLEIETVAGRGKWQVKALPEMAKKMGNKWLTDSVSDYLGLAILETKGEMKWWDKLSWWRGSGDVEWKNIELEKTQLVEEVKTPDGVTLLHLGPLWEEKAVDWFTSNIVSLESLNATVVNAAGVDGLGSHAARILESIGIKVNMIENSEEKFNKCIVESNSGTKEKTGAGEIVRIFGCDWKKGDLQDGELVLKLGEGYKRWWLGND